mmetsp:Transcript_60042/g.131987  ORF Transcript_60042/g.131987 Transcript_60042/m.131987 type:complete len:522 (+) Transcript_60042:126-1691(+)
MAQPVQTPAGVARLAASASSPELAAAKGGRDREKLHQLLANARGGEAASRRPPGGAPFSAAPKVRTTVPSTAASAQRLASCSSRRTATIAEGEEGGVGRSSRYGLSTGASSLPPATGMTQGTSAGSTSRQLTPRSKKAAAFVKKLVGGSDGQDALHWKLVQEMDAVDSILQDEQTRLRMQQQKEKIQSDLRGQAEQFQRRELDYRQSMKNWGDKLHADANLYKEEEKQKRLQTLETLKEHNAAQAKHVEDLNYRRRQEQLAEARLESEMSRRAQESKRRQDEADEKRKKRQKEMAEETAKAARESIELKAREKREEAMKDIELMKEQQRMLDEQERKRHSYFEQVRAKQEKMGAQYEAGAGNQLARLQREEEERAQKCQEERQRKEDQAHMEKSLRLKQMQKDSSDFIQKQLEEHAAQRVKEKEDNKRRREEAERDTQAASAEQRTKDQQRREREKENADFLKRQVSQKMDHVRLASEQMTAVERSLNRERLGRATEADSLQLLFKSKQLQYHAAPAAPDT